MFNVNRGHMAAAGNYGHDKMKGTTVHNLPCSLLMLTQYLKMKKIILEYGTRFNGIPGAFYREVSVKRWRLFLGPYITQKIITLKMEK